MTSVAWSDRYVTGIKAIDKDHSSLFDLLDTIREHERRRSSPPEVAATLHALEVYAAEHFEREERFMISGHFPDFDAHRRSHAEFRALVSALVRQYRQAPDTIALEKVSRYLLTWIETHILGSDMAYVPYLLGEVTAPPDAPQPSMPTDMLLRLPPEKHDVVRRFAALMRDGGEVAEALESTLQALERHHEQALDNRVRTLFAPDPPPVEATPATAAPPAKPAAPPRQPPAATRQPPAATTTAPAPPRPAPTPTDTVASRKRRPEA